MEITIRKWESQDWNTILEVDSWKDSMLLYCNKADWKISKLSWVIYNDPVYFKNIKLWKPHQESSINEKDTQEEI